MKKSLTSAGFTIIELMIASTIFTVLILLLVTTSIAVSQDLHKAVWSSDVQSDGRFTIDQIGLPIQLSGDSVVLGNNGYDWTVSQDPITGKPLAGHKLTPPLDTLKLYSLCIGNERFTWANGLRVQLAFNPGYVHSNHIIVEALWKDTISQGDASLCRPADITQVNPDLDCSTNPCKPVPSLYDNSACPANNPCTLANATGEELVKFGHGLKSLHVSTTPDGRLYHIQMELYYGDDDLLVRSTSPDDENIQSCKPISQGGAFCGITSLSTSVYRRLP